MRVDSGVYAGWNVPVDYDPMLAKLIVWHETRELAIARMLRALGEYHIGGIESNLSLFRTVLNDAAFRAGELDVRGIWIGCFGSGQFGEEAPRGNWLRSRLWRFRSA